MFPYRLVLPLLCLLTFASLAPLWGQPLQIEGGQNPSELVRRGLSRGDLRILSVEFGGDPSQLARFTDPTGETGLRNGLILSTGQAQSAPGPNLYTGVGLDNELDFQYDASSIFSETQVADADLDALAPNGKFFDRAYLRIRFIATSDTASFRFVFASEEYPEFTPPRDTRGVVNDLFGFFISGPGFPQRTNLALLPGTGQPLSLRVVNPAVNAAFFRPNEDRDAPLWQATRYDGLSVVLTAGARLVPCEEYEIYLVIADVDDAQYDTALLFEAGSFGGSGLSVRAKGLEEVPGQGAVTYEGCGPGTAAFNLERSGDLSQPLTIDVQYSGTATANVDYLGLTNRLTFAQDQSELQMALLTLWDELYPPAEDEYESIILTYDNLNAACPAYRTVSDTLWIKHTDSLRVTAQSPATACVPTEISLSGSVTGGTGVYLYQWLDGVSGGQASPDFQVNLIGDRSFRLEARDARCLGIPPGIGTTTTRAVNRDPNAPPLSLEQALRDTIICTANPVTLSARAAGGTGAYQYFWDEVEDTDGDTLVRPETTTRYILRVSDGCDEIRDTAWVSIFEPLSVQVQADPAGPYCAGRPVQLTAFGSGGAGNYTFTWDDATPGPQRIALPTETTTYSVIVSDRCGNASGSIRIVVQPALAFLETPNDTVICAGQPVTLRTSATGGDGNYLFVWNQGVPPGPSPTVQPGTTTTYRVILTDGCGSAPVVEDVTVRVLAATEPLRIERIEGPDTVCPGQTAEWRVIASGGTGEYGFRVNGGPLQSSNAFTLTVPNPTSYTFEVLDTCSSVSANKIVRHYEQHTVSLTAVPDTICVGTSARITAAVRGGGQPYTYTWSTDERTPAIDVSPTNTTTYGLFVEDGCGFDPAGAMIEVAVRPALQARISGARPVCPGERLTLTAEANGGDGDYSYRWSTGETTASIRIQPRLSGEWSVTITDGCGSSPAASSVTISILPGTTIAYIASPEPQCASRAMELRFTGFAPPDAVVSWDFGVLEASGNDLGPIFITAPAAGTYPVRLRIVSASCGAADSTFNLRFAPEPVAFFALPSAQCFGGHSFNVEASQQPDGTRYEWDFGTEAEPPTAEGRTVAGVRFPRAGSFPVRLRVRIGDCADEQTQSVTIIESPASPRVLSDTICSGKRAVLRVIDSDPALTYAWFTEETGGEPVGPGLLYETPELYRTTRYYVEATAANGCRSVPRGFADVEVRGAGRLSITADKDTAELPLGVVNFRASFDREPSFWRWNFGDGGTSNSPTPAHVYRSEGTYDVSLTVSDSFGCVASTVERQLVVVHDPTMLHVPDAFSPDDNYVNDEWYVIHRMIRDFEVWVFDKGGNLVFHSTDINFRWYGDVRGRDFRTRVMEGVYTWRIKAKTYNGTPIDRNGTLTVIY